ncbi:MAG: DegV family protein [Gordonia sp. (in: high G+C Gram-positive bacteria)]|uniref:DegV family protein n=1 Tax=Gordonia sp. (in: high G+C Gram-positive bacteria) TaxID=84139 RepID=UPI0039E21F74
MPVVIVTDSSSRLPAPLAERYGVLTVPLHVTMPDGTEYLEGVDPIPDDVVATQGVTTSGANKQELTTVYRTAIEQSQGDGVVAVHLSRRLSSTWANARMAAEEIGDELRVVDSRSVGAGVGLTVLAAAQAAGDGDDRDAVYEAAIRAAATGESLMALQTLENLRHSGRIGAASHLFASALSIKPILHIADGVLQLKERQRTMTKAVKRMVDTAVEEAGTDPVTIAVQHCQAPELAADVHRTLRTQVPRVTSSMIVDLGAVLGAHVGKGAVGVTLGRGLEPLDQ